MTLDPNPVKPRDLAKFVIQAESSEPALCFGCRLGSLCRHAVTRACSLLVLLSTAIATRHGDMLRPSAVAL